MSRPPAKVDTFLGVTIRLNKASGIFTADGFDEEWQTLGAARDAIRGAQDEAIDVPAYRAPRSWGDGSKGELEAVTIINIAPRSLRIRIDDTGRTDTHYGRGLYPRTPEVIAAWGVAQAKRDEAKRLEESAEALEEKLPEIIEIDDRFTAFRRRL